MRPHYRKVLWFALAVNALMFVVEIVMGVQSGSLSLLSDSLDFFGDAANYGISLWVLGMALHKRARASLLKAATMAVFGGWILLLTVYRWWWQGDVPNYHEMGVVGVLALAANLLTAWVLYAYRDGDSNMQSVWLCSRNDAVGNLLVMAAAGAVYVTQSKLPDLLVAVLMSCLALSAAWRIGSQAVKELRSDK
ncbi:cation transporter [Kingella potus]|uniref:cation transporter n=1 Tax=Kingella potus TaxID=265175 RepID=UPI001FD5DCEB|nr:cation transporter [Kingella potus]UOP00414.1 cation transporter [Kingella potus]